jgi:hypothetical protein
MVFVVVGSGAFLPLLPHFSLSVLGALANRAGLGIGVGQDFVAFALPRSNYVTTKAHKWLGYTKTTATPAC